MSSSSFHYKLTPQALDDLDTIWRYSAETWSLEQADRYIDGLTKSFETIVAMPAMARERKEFDPPVRIQPQEGHIIVYTIEDDHILIARVLGDSQNWQAILNSIDS